MSLGVVKVEVAEGLKMLCRGGHGNLNCHAPQPSPAIILF